MLSLRASASSPAARPWAARDRRRPERRNLRATIARPRAGRVTTCGATATIDPGLPSRQRMPHPPAGPLRVLVVDDRLHDSTAWRTAASYVDARLEIHLASTSTDLQRAIQDGPWSAVLCARNPETISPTAVLAMSQVLEPAPAMLLHPPLQTLEQHRAWLAAALGASLACTADTDDASSDTLDVPSIFGHVVNFTQRDVEALRALRASEERFRTLTEIAPVGIFLTDARQACVYVNARWSDITGVGATDAIGHDWRDGLQLGDDALLATEAFEADPAQSFGFESQIDRGDGQPTWVLGQMRPYHDANGAVVGHLGVITDITERKSAEFAMQQSEKRLRDLAKHMTSVEERQRAEIAREIHDDIGSSLTGMKIDVHRIGQLTADNAEVQEKLAMFTQLLDAVATSTTRIAKALRPGILDDGIVPAIEWQLREFSRRMDIDTEFNEPEREPRLSPDQSVALFRVVQESLNNIAKHADAKHVDVVLFAQGDELTLEIRDDGRGLPRTSHGPKIERRGGGYGFGITGMRERILSLGGWMDITGAPGKGTTVMVGIPMERRGDRG